MLNVCQLRRHLCFIDMNFSRFFFSHLIPFAKQTHIIFALSDVSSDVLFVRKEKTKLCRKHTGSAARNFAKYCKREKEKKNIY